MIEENLQKTVNDFLFYRHFLTEVDIESGSDSKKLELFDFDKLIETEKLKEVKNANILSLNNKNNFDDEGLWSELIFGRVGSKERKTRFGYIRLHIPMIRPVVYRLMKTYSEEIRDIIADKVKFKIEKTGELIEDESGETGLLFLLKNYQKINFASCAKKDKQDVGKFIENNKYKIFIHNYWILPPGGIRDMSVNQNAKQFTSEINDIYEKIISLNSQLELYEFDEEMQSVICHELHNFLVQAHLWVQTKMTGKGGLLRGTMLKKSVDYSARCIAMPSPEIPFGYIGIPWQVLCVIYEPFLFHYILKTKPEIQNLIKANFGIQHDKALNNSELKKITSTIQGNLGAIKDELKEALIDAITECVKDKEIIIKRDPVVSRGNYFSANIVVLDHGQGVRVNPLYCPPLTLDFDGDCVALFPVFTKQALKEAKNLNPAKSKAFTYNLQKTGEQNYNFQLDCISTIYAATKDPE